MTFLILLLAIAATLAIFATTTTGRALTKRLGFRDRVPGAASSDDMAYLLKACDGDTAELKRRISVESERYPEMTEAEHVRRAIRKVFNARESSSS